MIRFQVFGQQKLAVVRLASSIRDALKSPNLECRKNREALVAGQHFTSTCVSHSDTMGRTCSVFLKRES